MTVFRFVILFLLFISWHSGFAAQQAIQHWQTANGVPVNFIEAHDLPIVDLRISFRAGSARDDDLAGISQLLNGLLVEGTGDLSAQDIALQFDRVGAQLRHNSGIDTARLSLRSLSGSGRLQPLIDLFSRLIAQPAFPQAALERDRAAMLLNLAEQKNRIGSLLSTSFLRNLYAGHPYQNNAIVSESSLRAISRSDLVDFHRKYYVRSNASLAIVGDMTLEQAKATAEAVVKHLTAGKKADRLAPVPSTEGKTIRVNFDTPQTQVRVGMPVIRRHDPDYYALILGNHILGGNGSHSRLMKEIREEQGLSYSVHSSLSPLEASGPFEMGLQTRNHQVDEALELLDSLLKEFIEDGPTEQELRMAKKNITGGFALRLDSNRKLLNQLSVMGFYQLPLDYLDRYSENIQQVSADDIRRVFQKRIKPEQMLRVIVGPDSN